MKLRTNREELVVTVVAGVVAPALINSGIYDVSAEGDPFVLPSVGGINPNVRIGDGAFAFLADHIEPAVSMRNNDDRLNIALNAMSCIGNRVRVLSGDAKGALGRVTGTHGGVEHVIADFEPESMEKMAIGDAVQVRSCGLGLRLLDAPEVRAFNADPGFLDAWGIEVRKGRVHARVAKIVPATVMGSGLGRSTVVRGDYDIQCFDDEMVERYGLRDLRLGDLVAIVDADNSFGRIYRQGSITIGAVVHGRSFVAGHGPGVTTLLTSRSGAIEVAVDADANLATIFPKMGAA